MENYNYDNGHSRERYDVENNIRHLKKAIDNIGKDYMQTIRVCSGEKGMGQALQSGDYIDLSESPFVFQGIKEGLISMLEVQQEILEEINGE